jgi:glycosyltransferase involved in cell wall biosynthesis
MSVVIFGDLFSFPEGNAATNRVHTYAKGFYENGIITHVICSDSKYIPTGNGVTNGIYFYHPFGQRIRNKYFLLRRWYKFKKYIRAIRIMKEINKNDKIIAIIFYSELLHSQLLLFIFSTFIQSKIILERSEHPFRNFQGSIVRKAVGEIRIFLETKLSNGIICITQYLIDFYKRKGVSKKKLFLVPSTVDPERFQITHDSFLPFKYILYCGTLTILKDGVNILIESFNKISAKYPEINLVLIGKGNKVEEEIILKNLVIKLKIDKKVFFLGQLPRMEIPEYLVNATILALARPKSIIADAGFPSKLTEYLATGVPIVITNFGEISLYLKDKENIFISDQDSVDAYSTKIDFVLSNYDFAKKVALKGKELTNTIFNYNTQAKRLIGFISTLHR